MGHFNLLHTEEVEDTPNHYNEVLANTMFDGKMKGKILKFKDKAPAPKPGSQASSLHELYSYNYLEDKPKVQRRHVPSQPDRVLDAPGFVDDFYLNLIDWGATHLAIALTDDLYLWNSTTSETVELAQLSPEDESITSVKWMSPTIIAIGKCLFTARL